MTKFLRSLLGTLLLLCAPYETRAQHGKPRVVVPSSPANDSSDEALVSKYAVRIHYPGASLRGRPNCSAAVVSCEGAYYLRTAKHCWSDNEKNDGRFLKPNRKVSFDGGTPIELDLLEHSLGTREKKDQLKIKLASTFPLVVQAIKEKRVLKCTEKKAADFRQEKISALGWPTCVGTNGFVFHCTTTECRKSIGYGLGSGTALGKTCYTKSLNGMSGGPVMVQENGEMKFLGSLSHHSDPGPRKDSEPLIYGALVYQEDAGNWKESRLSGQKSNLP